jgi:hypothetical protein
MRLPRVASLVAVGAAGTLVADILGRVTSRAQDGDRAETIREALAGGEQHGHTSQIVSIPTDSDHHVGLVSVLLTHDQAPMAIAYSTNACHRSMDHTGTQVRIAAMGPHAANVVGISDQTDLFRTMLRAMPREVPSR